MISMPLRGHAAPVALALLLSHTPIVCEAVAQAPPGGQIRGEYNARDANAQARVLALADEVIAFIGEGYKAIPPGEVIARMDSYRARMRTLASEIADTPAAATLTTFLTQFEQIQADIAAAQVRPGPTTSGVTTTPPTGGDTAPARLRALLAEVTAANAYADLPPPQRLAALDAYLARLQALGPELAGTSVAAIYERALREGRQERTSVAAQLGRDPSMTSGANEGAYTDFEWMGQRGITALSNPLQREDFRASLARGIDFNVGVSAIEPTAAGWLVQMSGRPGTPGTPGQGFFCRVNGTDTASLTVLRGLMPPYGIVHMTSSRADEFVLSDRPLRVRIVFADCRITPPDD